MATFIFVIILFGALAIYGWASYMISPDDCVVAGTNTYLQGCPHPYRLPITIRGVKKRDTMLVRAAETGPIVQNPIENDAGIRYWYKGDTLIVDKGFWTHQHGDLTKGRFYLMEKEGEYRIVQCIANDNIMPPIFNDSSTLITHRLIGEVIAVYNHNRINYSIQHSKMIVPKGDW